jgi:hypothetical protein
MELDNKNVDEWGTAVLGYFMTGPPADDFALHRAVLSSQFSVHS